MKPSEIADRLRVLRSEQSNDQQLTTALADLVGEYFDALEERDRIRKMQGRDIGQKRIHTTRAALRSAVGR